MISSDEYAIQAGSECPVCHTILHVNPVSASGAEYGDGVITEEVRCSTCNSRWIELYTLTGYEDLVLGDQPDE